MHFPVERAFPRRGEQVPRTRRPYPPEFRAEAIRLARTSGKPLREIAGELGVSVESLRAWTKQTDIDQGLRTDGLTTEEREELRRLRRENRILRQEREILKKAAAFFAQETDSIR
jgi:transposase